VYRTEILLVPSQLLQARPDLLDTAPGVDGALNRHLAQAGWYVESEAPTGSAQIVTRLRVRSRSARPDQGGPGGPNVVSPPDAYHALRLLRQATAGGADAAAVAQISLDHLLFAISTIGGLPITEGHGDGARVPVAVLASPPRRRPLAEVPGGRRPVVVVLDTGIGTHPWLNPTGDPQDHFWVDATPSWHPHWEDLVGPEPEDDGISKPLVGTLDSHAGHGTFIAGLIRQIAPDASMLSLHVMYGDGVIHESDAINALGWLHHRVSTGGPAEFVDVICLSFGYYEETPADETVTSAFAEVLADLGNLGIRVVAAGGNHATERETYPAALTRAGNLPAIPLVSVGALNPNKTTAYFSNQALWITDWEVGNALLSTMPPFNGALEPEYRIPPAPTNGKVRESLDPDNFKGGFAIWSGTSFAAAAFAAKLAQALVTHLEGANDHTSLLTVTPSVAILRANTALTDCRPPQS